MADPPPYPGTGDNTGREHDREPARRRWVPGLRVCLVAGVILVMIALHLTGTIAIGGH